MDNHIRIGRPKSAYELFLKLYCKKKGSSSEKNNISLLAAANAWVTLKQDEKKTFLEKFTKCKEKQKNQIALRLEKMKPYMKKKQIKRISEVGKSQSLFAENNVHLPELSPPHTHGHIENTASINKSICTMSEASSILDQYNTKTENLDEYEMTFLSEPPPPSVRNSQDLFNIINKKGDNNMEWKSLSKVEKERYRKAVYELKKDYIQKYKMYLEHLPSRELYKYYRNIEIS